MVYLLAPISWMVISSISPERELASVPPHWFPNQPTLSNLVGLVTGSGVTMGESARPENVPFPSAIRNSVVVSAFTILICVSLAALASYSIARFASSRLRKRLLILMVSLRNVPLVIIIIPMYVLFMRLDLVNTVLGLIIIYSGIIMPYAIWLLTSYFLTIPLDIEEAAMVDGCSRMGAFRRIVLRLSVPGLLTTGIFVLLSVWSEFFIALVLTHTPAAQTIPVVTATFTGVEIIYGHGFVNAAGVIAMIPPLIVVTFLNKYIAKGLLSGAVKG